MGRMIHDFRRAAMSCRKWFAGQAAGNDACRRTIQGKGIKSLEGRVNMSVDLGIDLGTASVLVYVKGTGQYCGSASAAAGSYF